MNSRTVAGSALLGAVAVYLNRRLGERPVSANVWTALQHRNTELEAKVAEQKAELLEQQTRLAWKETHLAEKDDLIEQLGRTRAELRDRIAEQAALIATFARPGEGG